MNRVVRRVILMSLLPDDGAVGFVTDAHRSLEEIPGVACLAVAEPVRAVRGELSWSHASVLEFSDESVRGAYSGHPVHEAIRHVLDRWTSSVVVFDLTPSELSVALLRQADAS